MFRTISQKLGYSERGQSVIRVPSLATMRGALVSLGLDSDHLFDVHGEPTALGQSLQQYF